MTPSDTITKGADLFGLRSRAWRCDLKRMRASLRVEEGGDRWVAWWLVEAPWAHPMWHSYLLSLVHLRDLATGPRAVIHLPSATHEVALFALDPHGRRQMLIEGRVIGPGSVQFLTPSNFSAQFIDPSDAAADDRVRSAAQRICDGTLSPDTDFTWQWVELFGGNMIMRTETLQ